MIGTRIKEARQAQGLTQAEVAGDKLSRSYISAIEGGRINPSLQNLKVIAAKLGKPESYFLPDKQELLSNKIAAMLNQVRGYIGINEWSQAQSSFDECRHLYGEGLRPDLRGLYLEVQAELEAHNGSVLKSVDYFKAAARSYKSSGLAVPAWKCLYTAAIQLYLANHINYALFVALEAAESVPSGEGLSDEAGKTYYLVGSCYATLGNSESAQSHFSLAEEASSNTTEVSIKSLIAKASCYGKQEEWGEALIYAQKAAELASQIQLNWLKAEALIGAAVCAVNMSDTARADALLSELSRLPRVAMDVMRKAYREVILALSERGNVDAALPHEDMLKNLMQEPAANIEEWEQLKDAWALTKCSLLRHPRDVKEVTLSFSRDFTKLSRFRDAADVLSFGAGLLNQQSKPQEALELLTSACTLYKGRPQ